MNHCGCGTSPVYNVHTGCSEEGGRILQCDVLWCFVCHCNYAVLRFLKCQHNFTDVYICVYCTAGDVLSLGVGCLQDSDVLLQDRC